MSLLKFSSKTLPISSSSRGIISSFSTQSQLCSIKKSKQNSADTRLAPLKKAFNPLSRNYRQDDVSLALHRSIPSVEAHETIERAWKLHERHQRESRLAELSALHNRMKEAVEALKETHGALFHWATVPRDVRRVTKAEMEALKGTKGPVRRALEAKIEGLFPREMRVPTETPSLKGWNYDWTPPKAPSTEKSTSDI